MTALVQQIAHAVVSMNEVRSLFAAWSPKTSMVCVQEEHLLSSDKTGTPSRTETATWKFRGRITVSIPSRVEGTAASQAPA